MQVRRSQRSSRVKKRQEMSRQMEETQQPENPQPAQL